MNLSRAAEMFLFYKDFERLSVSLKCTSPISEGFLERLRFNYSNFLFGVFYICQRPFP